MQDFGLQAPTHKLQGCVELTYLRYGYATNGYIDGHSTISIRSVMPPFWTLPCSTVQNGALCATSAVALSNNHLAALCYLTASKRCLYIRTFSSCNLVFTPQGIRNRSSDLTKLINCLGCQKFVGRISRTEPSYMTHTITLMMHSFPVEHQLGISCKSSCFHLNIWSHSLHSSVPYARKHSGSHILFLLFH